MPHTRPLRKAGYPRQVDRQKGRFYGAASASPRPRVSPCQTVPSTAARWVSSNSPRSIMTICRTAGAYLFLFVLEYLDLLNIEAICIVSDLYHHFCCQFFRFIATSYRRFWPSLHRAKNHDPRATAVASPSLYETLSQILSLGSCIASSDLSIDCYFVPTMVHMCQFGPTASLDMTLALYNVHSPKTSRQHVC